MGVTGTPTVFVNRFRLTNPGRAELERAIEAARLQSREQTSRQ
jgi:protein-disulfide isomerase